MSTIVSERPRAARQVVWTDRLVHIGEPPQAGFSAACKRALDLLLASVLLVVAAVPMLFISLAILLDSGGPVIFAQQRVGRGGRRFVMFKFRSMRKDAEERREEVQARNHIKDGPTFKLKDDPRMTRVGRLLRRTSLDELPQLWNVVTGTMSLVGPRPPIESEVMEYEEWQMRRLAVQPGMTGLWQVNGRSDLSFTEMVRMDISYVDDWSLRNDLLLLLRTPLVVLVGNGAY